MKTEWKRMLFTVMLACGMIMFAGCKDDDGNDKKDDSDDVTAQTEFQMPSIAEITSYIGFTTEECMKTMEEMNYEYKTEMTESGLSMVIFSKTNKQDTAGYVLVAGYNKIIGAFFFNRTTDKKKAFTLAPNISSQAFVWMSDKSYSAEEYESIMVYGDEEYEYQTHQEYIDALNKADKSLLYGTMESLYSESGRSFAIDGVIPGSFDDIVNAIIGDEDDDEAEDDITTMKNAPAVYAVLGGVNAKSFIGIRAKMFKSKKMFNK